MARNLGKEPGTTIPGAYDRNVKRESAASALVQVVVALVVVSAGVFFYWKSAHEKERVTKLAHDAMEAARGDDAFALLKAKELYDEIGDEKTLVANDSVLSNFAELEAQLVQAYGLTSEKERAQHFVQLSVERDVKRAERYAAEAYLLIAEGKAVEAERVVTALTDRGVRHPKLLHALSVAKLAQGKAKEAAVAAEEGMKLSSSLVRLPIAQGDALLEQGNFPSASNAYRKALSLNGDHLRARTAIDLVQAISRASKPALLLKDLDGLLAEASAGGKAPPPRVKGFIEYTKGEVFLVDNDAAQAVALADQAIASDPSLAQALSLKGRALAKLGKIDDAKKAFTDALALAPSSIPVAKDAADTLARAGKAADGLVFLEKVRDANPDNGLAYVHLAIGQAQAGKGKDAVTTADLAVQKLGNNHELALFAKGRALQADGALDKARETYLEAISARGNADWPELFFEMGNIRLAEKNWDDASNAFQESIRLFDKLGGTSEELADSWDGLAKAYTGAGPKKAKEAKDAQDKAAALRKAKSA